MEKIKFITVPDNVPILYGDKRINQNGFLVYEYNPLKVLRYTDDVYEEDTTNGKYIKEGEDYILPDDTYKKVLKGYEKEGKLYTTYTLHRKNSLEDLDTEKLNFSLEYPVDIEVQPSYDGSVNLILNDNLNPPKLINSRFTSTGSNTYKIVDREGSNDTNIYDYDTFNSETSLYKISDSIVKLSFDGLSTGGNLKVGNYVFYFKLSDADGNETDFVAESSIVSCHIGGLKDPFSIRGGIEDENSFKSVTFTIDNIDSAYSYVSVYFTRTTASLDGSELTYAYKINNTFNIYNNSSKIYITGFETTTPISINDLNISYNLASSVKTQTIAQNMLFLGNIHKATINYKELTDISLRFLPHLSSNHNIGYVNDTYTDTSNEQYNYEYYNTYNIYNRLGYWNSEIYRFGVVYILEDYSLSPVFNVRGTFKLTDNPQYEDFAFADKEGNRQYIPIDKNNHLLSNGLENTKGVVKIESTKSIISSNGITPIGLEFRIAKECIKALKDLNIKGFFFVRQKRNKTILCQAFPIGIERVSGLPTLPIVDSLTKEKEYIMESFMNEGRILTHDFSSRLRKLEKSEVLENYGFICPEYEVNQAFFNQFFTGSEFYVDKAFDNNDPISNKLRSYAIMPKSINTDNITGRCTIIAVGDSMKYVKGKEQVFSAEAGDAADATKFSNIKNSQLSTTNSNYIRGDFGPYLGVENNMNMKDGIVNIRIPGYNPASLKQYFEIRFRDGSPFYAISDRYNINYLDNYNVEVGETYNFKDIYRGDCFICNFTHRMCRNFMDSETPTNDIIVDDKTWLNNYTYGENDSAEDRLSINRADVNAVKIGHWVTTKVMSNINLSFRCNDYSYTAELGLTGNPRSFYPLSNMDISGVSKLPESFIVNEGLNKSIGNRYNFEQALVPAIKDVFNTRILYSDISINDAYKNGFRVFRNANYRDYPSTYGSITKLVEWSGNIICIFEHGAAVIPVNERAVAANGSGGSVFINTNTVLPENPSILSSTFGSQWSDSIVKTPYGIYGVDTVAKKIWKISIEGSLNPRFALSVISDFKLQKFLNDNISLKENELQPIIGIRNVKTHYNAYKGDIMFTFYDDINTLEEKAWNLCYNELLGKFITFYSWLPSFSENIDNIYFSFDRTSSKNILSISYNSSDIIISNNNLSNVEESIYPELYYIGILKLNTEKLQEIDTDNIKGVNQVFSLGDNSIAGFSIKGDDNNNYKLYINKEIYNNLKLRKDKELFKVPIKGELKYYSESSSSQIEGITSVKLESLIYLHFDAFSNNLEKTYFWKHGQAGLMETVEDIKPTVWYGKKHPFEFEIVAVDNPSIHKIFTSLQLIANKAVPESLHFEISGEVYTFADDKKNIYFRQEAVKNLYQYNGGDIVYDSNYLKVVPEQRNIMFSNVKDKSTSFPIYYSRVNTINEIEDYYQSQSSIGKDYQRMSGTEVIYDKSYNSYKLVTHIKACPFNEYYKQLISKDIYDKYSKYPNFISETDDSGTTKYYQLKTYGRLNGNMDYLEDKWYMQIPSINYSQKNEEAWNVGDNNYPPLNVVNNPLPESMPNSITISDDNIPSNLTSLGYDITGLDTTKWTSIKETRIRDKYVRIKIRYSGDDLAIIYALKTLYTISYA